MEILVENRKVRFKYFILKELEAGLVLLSSEVRSLREKKLDISNSYVIKRDNEVWLHNLYIAEYSKAAKSRNHKIKRERKLLLHRNEIIKLIHQTKNPGIAIVPLLIYFNNKGLVKAKIAVVKGKKLYDKRAILRKKEWNLEKNRSFKENLKNNENK